LEPSKKSRVFLVNLGVKRLNADNSVFVFLETFGRTSEFEGDSVVLLQPDSNLEVTYEGDFPLEVIYYKVGDVTASASHYDAAYAEAFGHIPIGENVSGKLFVFGLDFEISQAIPLLPDPNDYLTCLCIEAFTQFSQSSSAKNAAFRQVLIGREYVKTVTTQKTLELGIMKGHGYRSEEEFSQQAYVIVGSATPQLSKVIINALKATPGWPDGDSRDYFYGLGLEEDPDSPKTIILVVDPMNPDIRVGRCLGTYADEMKRLIIAGQSKPETLEDASFLTELFTGDSEHQKVWLDGTFGVRLSYKLQDMNLINGLNIVIAEQKSGAEMQSDLIAKYGETEYAKKRENIGHAPIAVEYKNLVSAIAAADIVVIRPGVIDGSLVHAAIAKVSGTLIISALGNTDFAAICQLTSTAPWISLGSTACENIEIEFDETVVNLAKMAEWCVDARDSDLEWENACLEEYTEPIEFNRNSIEYGAIYGLDMFRTLRFTKSFSVCKGNSEYACQVARYLMLQDDAGVISMAKSSIGIDEVLVAIEAIAGMSVSEALIVEDERNPVLFSAIVHMAESIGLDVLYRWQDDGQISIYRWQDDGQISTTEIKGGGLHPLSLADLGRYTPEEILDNIELSILTPCPVVSGFYRERVMRDFFAKIAEDRSILFIGMRDDHLAGLHDQLETWSNGRWLTHGRDFGMSALTTSKGYVIYFRTQNYPDFSPVSGDGFMIGDLWKTKSKVVMLAIVVNLVSRFTGRHESQIEQIFWSTVSCIQDDVPGIFVDFNFNGYDFAGFLTMILTMDLMQAPQEYIEVFAISDLEAMRNSEKSIMSMVAPDAQVILAQGYPKNGIWDKDRIEEYLDQLRPNQRSSATLRVVSCANRIGLSWLASNSIALAFVHVYVPEEVDDYWAMMLQSLSPKGVLIMPDFARPFRSYGNLHKLSEMAGTDMLEVGMEFCTDISENQIIGNVAKEVHLSSYSQANGVSQLAAAMDTEPTEWISPVLQKRSIEVNMPIFLCPMPDEERRAAIAIIDRETTSDITILHDDEHPLAEVFANDYPSLLISTVKMVSGDSVYDVIVRDGNEGGKYIVVEAGISPTIEGYIWCQEAIRQLKRETDRCGLVCGINPCAQDSNIFLVNISTFFPAMGLFAITYETAEVLQMIISEFRTENPGMSAKPFSSMILADSHFTRDEVYPDLYQSSSKEKSGEMPKVTLCQIIEDFFAKMIELHKEGLLPFQAQTWLGLAYAKEFAIASPSSYAIDGRDSMHDWKSNLLKEIDGSLIGVANKAFKVERVNHHLETPVILGRVETHREQGGILQDPERAVSFLSVVEEFFGFVHLMGPMIQKINSLIISDRTLFEPTRKSFPVINKLFRESVLFSDFDDYHDSVIAAWESIERYCHSRTVFHLWITFCIGNSKVDAFLANGNTDILKRFQHHRSSLFFESQMASIVNPTTQSYTCVRHGFPPVVEGDTRHGFLLVDRLSYTGGETEFLAALCHLSSETLKLDIVSMTPTIDPDLEIYLGDFDIEVTCYDHWDGESRGDFLARVISEIREKTYDCMFVLPEVSLSLSTRASIISRYQLATNHFLFEPSYPVSLLDTELNQVVFSTKLAHPRQDTGEMLGVTEKVVCLTEEKAPPMVFVPVRGKDSEVHDSVEVMLQHISDFVKSGQTIVVIARGSRLSLDALRTWGNIAANTGMKICLILPKLSGYFEDSCTLEAIAQKIGEVFVEKKVPIDNIGVYSIGHNLPIDLTMLANATSGAVLYLDTLWTDQYYVSVPYIAGVPVLTIESEEACHRTAGCYNRILGHESLITRGWPEFEQRAIEILKDPDELKHYASAFNGYAENGTSFLGTDAAIGYCKQVLQWVERFSPAIPQSLANATAQAEQGMIQVDMKELGIDPDSNDDQK